MISFAILGSLTKIKSRKSPDTRPLFKRRMSGWEGWENMRQMRPRETSSMTVPEKYDTKLGAGTVGAFLIHAGSRSQAASRQASKKPRITNPPRAEPREKRRKASNTGRISGETLAATTVEFIRVAVRDCMA